MKAREEVLRKRLDELEGAGAAAATAAAATAAAAAAAAAAITTTSSSSNASITATNTPPHVANGFLSESARDIDMIDRSMHSVIDETDDRGAVNANSPTYSSPPFVEGAAIHGETENAPSPLDENSVTTNATETAVDAKSASTRELDATDERPSKRIRLADIERAADHDRDGYNNNNNNNRNNNIDEGSRTLDPLSSGRRRSLPGDDDATTGDADTYASS